MPEMSYIGEAKGLKRIPNIVADGAHWRLSLGNGRLADEENLFMGAESGEEGRGAVDLNTPKKMNKGAAKSRPAFVDGAWAPKLECVQEAVLYCQRRVDWRRDFLIRTGIPDSSGDETKCRAFGRAEVARALLGDNVVCSSSYSDLGACFESEDGSAEFDRDLVRPEIGPSSSELRAATASFRRSSILFLSSSGPSIIIVGSFVSCSSSSDPVPSSVELPSSTERISSL